MVLERREGMVWLREHIGHVRGHGDVIWRWDRMRIIAADSASSVLDENFMPTNILSITGVLIDFPYGEPLRIERNDVSYPISDTRVLIHELELCERMLEKEKADCVHLDLNLGGMNLLDLTEEMILEELPLSKMGREVLHRIFPDLRRIALSIEEKYMVPIYAMGKRSLAVRLAEIWASAYGIVRAVEKVRSTRNALYIGLPLKVTATFEGNMVRTFSSESMEEGLCAEMPVVLEDVRVEVFLNPVVRGYRAIRLSPKC